ncbi:glycosyltransferase 25 family member [Drosophila gunungcola]|uniref:glycosyltransferase 25 family member n=1 Tax=Drosophila gunungcola TaxID=103775 RepID=UPI0022E22007|nr:glycosyltransferase 25 family member [Drosophila gunungcola]
MKKQVIFGLLLASVLVCIAGQDEEDYQEPPTVLIALLVRNKAHTLPMFLSYLDQQDYPKQRIAFWLRCDHSNDDSIDILRNWLDNSADLYQSVKYVFEPQDRSYLNESSPYEWPASRFKHLIAMKEEAFQYGREIWADFMFFLDADVLLTSKDALKTLTRLQLPIVAPMLISESLYSNFWCGMTEDYYYRRTDEYKEIYHVKKQGSFPVPMVHTAVLVNMNHRVVRRNLTFDKSRLLEMQRSRQQEPLYEGPADDIIVFAISANSSGIPLHICNDINFGYILQPLEPGDSLDHDLQQLVNLRALMVNDLGGVPPLLDYYKHLAKKPEKSKLSLDRIFMINLKRRPERREKMEQLFEELGIEAEYFPAVDGKELTTERLQEMGVRFLPGYEDPYHHRAMTMGEIGCFLSHYSIWVMMVRKGLKEVLILEDDIRFEPYFRQNAVRFLNQARSAVKYDLIYFGRKRLKEESEPFVANADNLVHAGYSYWTLGYVLSLQGALKLLAAKPLEKLIPVDEFLPLMFDRHPNKTWSEAFPKRNLVALSASPLLMYPIYYTGDSSYISDTEDSQQINVDTSEEGEARLKSDREQVFDQAEECTLDKQLKLGESLPKSHQEL